MEQDVYVFPASFAQQRLWFLNQLEPHSSSYNNLAAMRISGPLDTNALAGGLNEIVRRHESLRTTFVMEGANLVQIVAPALALPLPVVLLNESHRQEGEVLRIAKIESELPFDLCRGPLIRIKLLRVDESVHILLLTVHHIVFDGWSTGVFARELETLYDAFRHGRPSPLPDLPIQYGDFAIWQRQWLHGAVLQKLLAYWQQQLAGAPQTTEVPPDVPRQQAATDRGATHAFVLPADLLASLKALSRDQRATLFMTLLAAFQVVLYHRSQQRDLVVGTDVANRNPAESERLIGFFVNQVVLRTKMADEVSFRDLLEQVRETVLGALAHQDLPFERLVEGHNPQRSLSHAPLFQVKLVLQNAPSQPLVLPGVTVSALDVPHNTAKFDLMLTLSECAEGLQGKLEYRTDLYHATTVRGVAQAFDAVLRRVVLDASVRVEQLRELLASVQRQDQALNAKRFRDNGRLSLRDIVAKRPSDRRSQ